MWQGLYPIYLSDLLSVYTPKRNLRSSSDNRILCIPKLRTNTFGHRSFSFAAPTIWNFLPSELRHADSIQKFKLALKTHLFCNLYAWYIKKIFYPDFNHYIWSTSTCVRLRDCESLTCDNYYFLSFIYTFLLLLLWSIRLHVPVSVRDCTIDYLIETICIYICAILCF